MPKQPDIAGNLDPIVYVIDDDPEIRDALLDLLAASNKRAAAFASGKEFLERAHIDAAGCVLVDFRMPGLNGLDLQDQLATMGSNLPVIFLTAFADIPTSVRAMKAGAADFITKPFDSSVLLDAIENAIELNREQRKHSAEKDHIDELMGSLTPRENEVMQAVVRGLMNKQIAFELGISEMTVKLHRMSLMRKMQVRSLAELVRTVEHARR
ncbi:response regulator (plasmid) [Ensifer adhaerens]|uniref:response regulator transcription factor n=1 Tax=Ensifer adhaerens TaxID=106592 RepID=UPI0023A9EF79|nr:response regulator [Ensifer adhaerens]WDZ79337.1 response regulator [Ensifer adhaerens]